MKRFIMIVLLLLINLISFSYAIDIEFAVKDVNGNRLSNMYVKLMEFDQQTAKTSNTYLFDLIKISLESEETKLIFLFNNDSTEGNDYYSSYDYNVNNLNYEIMAYPIGSIMGIVYDNLDNAVDQAKLKFVCNNEYGMDNPKTTDNFGSFSNKYFAVGDCRIYAEHNGKMGYIDISVSKGDLKNIEIRLDKDVKGKNSTNIILIPLFVVFIVIIGVIYAKKRKKNKNKLMDETPIIASPNQRSQRTEDIMKTLPDNEREIVEFLLKNNNISTQAKIRHSLMIPKTSLFRYVKSLESKNIIIVKTFGNLKKLELTDFFLDKN